MQVQRVVKSAEWKSEDNGVKGDSFRYTHTLTADSAEDFLPGKNSTKLALLQNFDELLCTYK